MIVAASTITDHHTNTIPNDLQEKDVVQMLGWLLHPPSNNQVTSSATSGRLSIIVSAHTHAPSYEQLLRHTNRSAARSNPKIGHSP